MRAAIFRHADSPITIEDRPEPQPAADELLIEIGRCGICGSDVSMTSGSPFDYPEGQCFGHEYAGTVVETGRAVSGWRAGDRVACMPNAGCGACQPCREGRLLFCTGGRGQSFGFAERAAVAASSAIRLPSSLSLADGALVEPMACGLRALTVAGLQRGDSVLVLGAGSMALGVIWWARELGAGRIVVASRSSHRRAICQVMGADAVYAFDEDGDDALDEALGVPAHIVAECVGKPGFLKQAIGHVRLGGTVIGMGMCMAPEPILSIGLNFKEARLVFPLAYSVEQFETTARAFDARGFNPEIMVSDVVPLEALPAMFGRIREGGKMLKVHVDPRISA